MVPWKTDSAELRPFLGLFQRWRVVDRAAVDLETLVDSGVSYRARSLNIILRVFRPNRPTRTSKNYSFKINTLFFHQARLIHQELYNEVH